jgi:hypothetical protein
MDCIDALLSDSNKNPLTLSVKYALSFAYKSINKYYSKTDMSNVYRIAMGAQYFTLPHMSLWTLCRLCGVCVESVQTPRTLIHLSKVHTDSVQTPHGLCMDFAQTYILQ